MKAVVSAEAPDIDAAASPVFGRCPAFVFVDTETMAFEGVANPAVALGGGAGIQAAQLVVDRGANAVLSHSVGPNAFEVLQAAGVLVYRAIGGTVRQNVEALLAGSLESLGGANAVAHAGIRGR